MVKRKTKCVNADPVLILHNSYHPLLRSIRLFGIYCTNLFNPMHLVWAGQKPVQMRKTRNLFVQSVGRGKNRAEKAFKTLIPYYAA